MPDRVQAHSSSATRMRFLIALWLCAFLAVPVWIHFDTSGWDVAVYAAAMRVLRTGGDPYSAAMAVQTAVHQGGGTSASADPPYSYVYSPITLPLLRLLALLPASFTAWSYWMLYGVAALAQVWVGLRAVTAAERRVFLFLAPLAPFFPGLLANGTLLGGNVAYLLYACVLLATVHGVRRGRWLAFYGIVLLASCVKAPLLSLVLLAPLLARRQWPRACVAAATGVLLFALQPMLWPALFRHYLQAVDLQFRYNRDFGCSPAGLFSGFLYDHGIAYSPAGLVFYVAYAIPLVLALVLLSRRYLAGRITLQQWLPVLLVGVILLNPRLIEYDVAPLALPLALIGWRTCRRLFRDGRTAAVVAVTIFLVANALALWSWTLRKALDGPLLVLLFLAGAYPLLRAGSREAEPEQELQVPRASEVPGAASHVMAS